MKKFVLACFVCGLVLLLLFAGVFGVGGAKRADADTSCANWTPEPIAGGGVASTAGVSAVGAWKGEQLSNAAAIINAGAEMGVSRRAQTIAVMTAMGESSLLVLDRGDSAGPDSRGLFQQRDSWGSYEVRMDPRGSAKLFYTALLKVPGWESLEPTIAAHRTQRNADPYHYARFWSDAEQVVEKLVRATGSEVSSTPQASAAPGDKLERVTPQLRALVNLLAPKFGIDSVGGYRPSAHDMGGHPSGRAADFMVPMTDEGHSRGQALADYAQKNASSLGIDYIMWNHRIWSVGHASEGWRWVDDRGSATLNHLDHVHINVLQDGPIPGAAEDFAAAVADTWCEQSGSSTGGSTVVYPLTDAQKYDRKSWHDYGIWAKWHTGTDFSVGCGTPVYASHAGTVEVTSDAYGGPFLTKVVTGPNSLSTAYWHMQKSFVKNGQQVQAGDQLGEVGELGNSTGCHLHFEVHLKNGSLYADDNVDPTKWLAENVGKTIGGGPEFVVATWNVLGALHTAPGGSRPGWPDWDVRMPGTVRAINASGAEIIGMQEFQSEQRRRFTELAGTQWDVWPSAASSSFNAVAWRTDRWEMVSNAWLTIPYWSGQNRDMPYVLLRSRSTGRQVWVASFHNPANTFGDASAQRAASTKLEADLANRLQAQAPVLFVGDMNAREPYFCSTVALSSLRSASGGSVSPCRIAPGQGIDWIMGAKVAFRSFKRDASVTQLKLSDHALVTAVARLE